jgi:hypothetical protein
MRNDKRVPAIWWVHWDQLCVRVVSLAVENILRKRTRKGIRKGPFPISDDARGGIS